ncbi:hypothetical protein Cpin_6092 [Chitinophaga pinensis DSM 2588]|uniref:Uncharacterized protein n=1 Tax=Chitinophaga pinensis (strain ATCC 43595 / DSM 2588 / LMG 13176 / NBRC 15968 / NCIMB 11800 / UQM 2034) TaxID=485918 RepID=A0A979GYY2_CHIPD|nr:hypothetical protein Cpin_6092 [Chitinophaga pinensis DSM 2588]
MKNIESKVPVVGYIHFINRITLFLFTVLLIFFLLRMIVNGRVSVENVNIRIDSQNEQYQKL